MSFRDTQIVISRQSVLLVTGVGVGLLTLAYVLGVQVGKQSAALRRPATRTVEDELKSLPEPLLDQLKIFESPDSAPSGTRPKPEAPGSEPESKQGIGANPKPAGPASEPRPVAPAAPKADPKAKPVVSEEKNPKPEPASRIAKPDTASKASADPKDTGGTFNLQLVATPDPKEAARVTAKAKAAGYATTIIQDGKLLKIRLAKPLPKADADIAATKLIEKGLKPFVTKAD
jgi:cell division protein FtsN